MPEVTFHPDPEFGQAIERSEVALRKSREISEETSVILKRLREKAGALRNATNIKPCVDVRDKAIAAILRPAGYTVVRCHMPDGSTRRLVASSSALPAPP